MNPALSVVRMLSPEARSLVVAVVELARSSDAIGPESPPPHVERWARTVAGDRVPWQLVAAAVAGGDRATADRAGVLVELVQALGMVDGVTEWCDGDRSRAGEVVLGFLAYLARSIDREGLDLIARVFA